jgi:hypothetical protein
MKIILIFLSLIIILPLISGLYVDYTSPPDSTKMLEIISSSDIKDNNMCTGSIIQVVITNSSNIDNSSKFKLYINAMERGTTFFPINNLSIVVCDEVSGTLDFNNDEFNCHSNVPYSLERPNIYGLNILLSLKEIKGNYFVIVVNYCINNFIIVNGEYEVAWLTSRPPNGVDLTRTLILPYEAPILEHFENFKLRSITPDNKRWELETIKGQKESQVWYRDANKEKIKSIAWEYAVLLLGLGFTIIFSILQLYLHKKNFLNNLSWFFIGLCSLFLGFGGIMGKLNFIFWGLITGSLGAILLSISFLLKPENDKTQLLYDLISGKKKIEGLGKSTINKLKSYLEGI